MKKAFVSVLLAVGLLSACSNQNIEINHPTEPPTEAIHEVTKPTEVSSAKANGVIPLEPTEPKQEATEPLSINEENEV